MRKYINERLDQGSDLIEKRPRLAKALGAAAVIATAAILSAVPQVQEAIDSLDNMANLEIVSDPVVCPQEGGTVMTRSGCD